jgi:hypothetical protein
MTWRCFWINLPGWRRIGASSGAIAVLFPFIMEPKAGR